MTHSSAPSNLIHVQHPLIEHHLCTVRDAATPSREFREAIRKIAVVLGVKATADLTTKSIVVDTPLARAEGYRLSPAVGLVPILRAGLGMVEPMLELMPDAAVWHLGMYRNEATAEPVGYYDKLPRRGAPQVAFVLDPMLATGGSIDMVVRRLMDWGVHDIRVVGVIASQDGIDRVQRDFPTAKVFVAAIDPTLNEQNFIVPGLGDAGDRIFDTPQND